MQPATQLRPGHALEELAATIKAEGRIHELLVRPIVPPPFKGVEGSTAGHEDRPSATAASVAPRSPAWPPRRAWSAP